MDKFIASSDETMIHYTVSAAADTALVFIHGWLGSGCWWESQVKYFSAKYCVVTVDLAGHGKSGGNRHDWSSKRYSDDIAAAVNQIESKNIVLVGHSMSGAYALEAALAASNVKAVVLVDTLKDMDQLMTVQQAEEFIFSLYRKNFKYAVENVLPKFLFCDATPEGIRKLLQNEFLQNNPESAIKALKPLYEMDVVKYARQIEVPVRAINSAYTPTNLEANQKYFRNYKYLTICDTGHYPMLEKPAEFNKLLAGLIEDLGL
ncbi:MAG TPA: alpha/beta hydrolase [Candidatus Wallbacteria bacterium]|nr:alpha/beta hydrolase [Candidatus Wallbacteria bacterium]